MDGSHARLGQLNEAIFQWLVVNRQVKRHAWTNYFHS